MFFVNFLFVRHVVKVYKYYMYNSVFLFVALENFLKTSDDSI